MKWVFVKNWWNLFLVLEIGGHRSVKAGSRQLRFIKRQTNQVQQKLQEITSNLQKYHITAQKTTPKLNKIKKKNRHQTSSRQAYNKISHHNTEIFNKFKSYNIKHLQNQTSTADTSTIFFTINTIRKTGKTPISPPKTPQKCQK